MMKFCVEKFGGLDVLINNAGMKSRQRYCTDITDEDLGWDFEC